MKFYQATSLKCATKLVCFRETVVAQHPTDCVEKPRGKFTPNCTKSTVKHRRWKYQKFGLFFTVVVSFCLVMASQTQTKLGEVCKKKKLSDKDQLPFETIFWKLQSWNGLFKINATWFDISRPNTMNFQVLQPTFFLYFIFSVHAIIS